MVEADLGWFVRLQQLQAPKSIAGQIEVKSGDLKLHLYTLPACLMNHIQKFQRNCFILGASTSHLRARQVNIANVRFAYSAKRYSSLKFDLYTLELRSIFHLALIRVHPRFYVDKVWSQLVLN